VEHPLKIPGDKKKYFILFEELFARRARRS